MQRYERNDVLQKTDLRDLATELLGPPRGQGRSAMWSCPDPGHTGQTGKTPPLSVFDAPSSQRWRCHGCGASGTAIDLLIKAKDVDVREAIEQLGSRLTPGGRAITKAAVRTYAPAPATRQPPRKARPAVLDHIQQCESLLWSPRGSRVLGWLRDRGFTDECLKANHVGADPGPTLLKRAKGIPHEGVGVVFPAFRGQEIVYFQTRYLELDHQKFDNPSTFLAGYSPRLVDVQSTGDRQVANRVVVSEGIPDGLTVAQTGERVAVVLGVTQPDQQLAEELVKRFPSERFVLAFDADHYGQGAAARLGALLKDCGAERRFDILKLPDGVGDLNAWRQEVGDADRFTAAFRGALIDTDATRRMFVVDTPPLLTPTMTAAPSL